MPKVLFKREADTELVPIEDGQLVYDSDSGESFIDVGENRIPVAPGLNKEQVVKTEEKGQPNGVCPLGPDGKIPLEYGGGVPITLTATTDPGATVTATDGVTTLTREAPEGTAVFSLPNGGEWTASAEKDGEQYGPSSTFIKTSYETNLISRTLNKNSWETIHNLALIDQGENYWAVGDTKSIIIHGQVGKTTFDNLAIDVFIIGFNHNASLEGNHKIHFQIGKINNVDIALCDSIYNGGSSSYGYFTWNPNDKNEGGWERCYKRISLYGSTKKPTSPLEDSLMSAMPEELRKVIQPVTKYTNNVGKCTTSNCITHTTDYLWDLAEFEVQGLQLEANKYEQNSQQQYQYYKAGNPKIAYNHTDVLSLAIWGNRSPYYGNPTGFAIVNDSGGAAVKPANISVGLRPGFAV